jgi:hypothetical protein
MSYWGPYFGGLGVGPYFGLLTTPSTVGRGAIHINQAAQNYRFQVRVESSHYTDRLTTKLAAAGILEIGWGSTDSTHKIKVEILQKWDASLTTPTEDDQTEYIISHPWGSTITLTPNLWDTDFIVLVEADNIALSVAADCEWELTFDEVRIYVDGTLEETIGAQTLSGSGFDMREDVVRLETEAMDWPSNIIPTNCIAGEGSGPQSVCGYAFGSLTAYEERTSIKLTGGWQFDSGSGWESDWVEIASPTMPGSTCTCDGTFYVPVATGNDSWLIESAASWRDKVEKFQEASSRICTCDDGTGNTNERHYWYWTQDYEHYRTWVDAIPKVSRIYDHDYTATIDCNSDFDNLASSATETLTYSAIDFWVDTRLTEKHCYDVIGIPLPCTFPNPCLPEFPVFTDTFCCIKIYGGVSWPTAPTCVIPLGLQVAIDRDLSWRHYRVWSVSAGTLEYGESDNALTWSDSALAFTGEYVGIAVAQNGKPVRRILVSDSGDIKLYRANPGDSFALESTLGIGEHVAIVTAQNGLNYQYWRDGTEIKGLITDASENVIEPEFVAVATVDDDSDVDVTYSPVAGSGHRITLQVIQSATVVTLTSTDNGVTFA